MESEDLNIYQMLDESVVKYRFELKLWLATNSSSVNYLRWNRNRTVLIVDVGKMEEFWRSSIDPIFLCDNKDTFLWLLNKSGFDRCALEVLDENEREEIDLATSVLVRHPQFVGSNAKMFTDWIALSSSRVRQNEVKGNCTSPSAVKFATRENLTEFESFRKGLLAHMEKIDAELWRSVNTANERTIVEKYSDHPVLDTPVYGMKIEGFYGPVTAHELEDVLGDLLPKHSDANLVIDLTTDSDT